MSGVRFVSSSLFWLSLIPILLSIPQLVNGGSFTLGGYLWLTILFGLFYVTVLKKKQEQNNLDTPTSLFPLLLLFSQVLGFIFVNFDANGINTLAQLFFRAAFTLGIILTFLWATQSKNAKNSQWITVSLFAIAIFLRLMVLHIVVNPMIDVFDVYRNAGTALLLGYNPYQQGYGGIINAITTSGFTAFPYWPVPLYLSLILKLFVPDPRYTLIIIEIFLSIIMYLDLKRAKVADTLAAYLPLSYLFFPAFPLVTARSYLDPIALFFLYLAFRFRKRNQLLSGISWGLIVGTKYLYLPPMIVLVESLARIKAHLKIILVSILTTFTLLLPFLLWNGKAFITESVTRQFSTQLAVSANFSLSLAGFLWLQFHNTFIMRYWIIPAALVYVLLIWRRSFISLEFEYTLVVYLVTLVFPYSYLQQYYFLFGVMIIAIALGLQNKKLI